MPDVQDEIRALLEERRGYLLYGKVERAAAVDAQLAVRGYQEAASERAASAGGAPKRRRSPRETA